MKQLFKSEAPGTKDKAKRQKLLFPVKLFQDALSHCRHESVMKSKKKKVIFHQVSAQISHVFVYPPLKTSNKRGARGGFYVTHWEPHALGRHDLTGN